MNLKEALPDLPPMEYAGKFGFEILHGMLFWADVPLDGKSCLLPRELQRFKRAQLPIAACAIRACEYWFQVTNNGNETKAIDCRCDWLRFEAELLKRLGGTVEVSEVAKKAADKWFIDEHALEADSRYSSLMLRNHLALSIQAAIDEAVKAERERRLRSENMLAEVQVLLGRADDRALKLAKALKPLTQWPQTGEDRDRGAAILADYLRETGEEL